MSEKEPIVRGVRAVEQILRRLDAIESRLENLMNMIQCLPEYRAEFAKDAMLAEHLCRETSADFSEEDVDEFLIWHSALE